MGNSKTKIVIVGIDGATWDLISSWAEKGLLPTFHSLMTQGKWGALKSTTPPVTAPAWTSMITGRNPGKHGLFDFTAHKSKDYGITYTYGGQRHCPTIWKTLSEKKFSAGIINVPMTFPPETVNGYMISGMDAPDENSAFIFPDHLKNEIKSKVCDIRLDIHHLGHMNTDKKRFTILDELEAIEEERFDIVEYLYNKHPTDILMVVLNAVDQVQHHFWHYMDSSHPKFDAHGHNLFGDAILRIYKRVDSILAKFLNLMDKDATLMIVSDHGFGPSSNKKILLNKALSQGGFLNFNHSRSVSGFIADHVGNFVKRRFPQHLKKNIANAVPFARAALETQSVSSNILWDKTLAYAFEISVTSPNIWINVKNKRPQGRVDKKDYSRVVEDIRQFLMAMKDPKYNKKAFSAVYTKEELYHGPALDHAPDLILQWWGDNGFTPAPSVVNGKVSSQPIVTWDTAKVVPGKEWGGTHQLDGIILMHGPGISPGKFCDASILDIAPTVFALLKEPLLDDFDGKSLIEHTGPVSQAREDTPASSMMPNDNALSEQDMQKLHERLKNLGYVE